MKKIEIIKIKSLIMIALLSGLRKSKSIEDKREVTQNEHATSETRTFMLDYLKKGATLGDKLCIKELGELYIEGKYVPKDTTLGKKLMGGHGF